MYKNILLIVILFISAFLTARRGVCEESKAPVNAYALVVGSTRFGQEKDRLPFNNLDADRVKDVLIELGGYQTANVKAMYDPNLSAFKSAIANFAEHLFALKQQGEETEFFLYYSGYARECSLQLGLEEFPFDDLRILVDQIPAARKLVVLDVSENVARCFKKAFKGSDSAYMVFSSKNDLLRESVQLGGSFFTHHLVVGLRGAADKGNDGSVTLAEAHEYVRRRRLERAGGSDEIKAGTSIEANLTGKREMVLTRPSEKPWSISISPGLNADVVIYEKPRRTLVADLGGTRGESVGIVLPPASYEVLLRTKDGNRICEVVVGQPGEAAPSRNPCVSFDSGKTAERERDKELDQVAFVLRGKVYVKELESYWEEYKKEHAPGQRYSDYMYEKYRLRRNAGLGLTAFSGISAVTGVALYAIGSAGSFGSSLGHGIGDAFGDYTAADEQEYAEEQRRFDIERTVGLVVGITGIVLLPIGISLLVSGKRGINQLNPHRFRPKTAFNEHRLSVEPLISLHNRSAALLIGFSF
jgi:hypothetical protein